MYGFSIFVTIKKTAPKSSGAVFQLQVQDGLFDDNPLRLHFIAFDEPQNVHALSHPIGGNIACNIRTNNDMPRHIHDLQRGIGIGIRNDDAAIADEGKRRVIVAVSVPADGKHEAETGESVSFRMAIDMTEHTAATV